ncbi:MULTISPECIES: DUF2254 domain-containing protein [Mycolicibacterium]|uniref:DUF2254 domain-containing protein n=1 Tax=Mycolicibacterium gilvum (strain PYR-GCK) TaxID=350054 RepID=A4TBS3_MYCGI|nr:DUF2254 domain-containing protein [Mycolicibacterium sp. PAM1]ABP46276.1 conserved hypothetical protein [Mycolicibacterium gilvum PYR-GCK]MBV5243990.1 DUF2254 domain-containing protein [Mycolicibacterium sp. PAM1]
MSRDRGGDRDRPWLLEAVRRRRTVFVDAWRSRLWPVPALGVVFAIVAGVALPELDAALDKRMPETLSAYLFGGGADAAREVLGAIATSLITVTSLTFSLTVVTLQLASTQYTPRLLRTFAADPFVQRTLALFLATFVYALTVLRTVRNDADAGAEFVPQLSVTVAYLLAMVSVLALVLFLGHLVRQIRIETMLDHVSSDIETTARRMLKRLDDTPDHDYTPFPPTDASVVTARSSGFLVEVDEQALFAAAVEADVVVWIDRPVGSDIVSGVPAALCWSTGPPGDPLSGERLSRLREQVRGALSTGLERTAAQDIGYGLRQLTDVVVRALSPGINDPTTAVHGLNSCSATLCELARYRLGRRTLRDDDGVVRVVLARPDLPDLLDMVCDQPQLYGASDPTVLARLVSMLRELAWVVVVPAHREALSDRLRRMERVVAEQDFDSTDRDRLDRLINHVREALDRRWPAT